MSARVGQLFKFAKEKSARKPETAGVSTKSVAVLEEPQAPDGAKASVSDLIIETIKHESCNARTSSRKTVTVERRHRRRVRISAPLRVRQLNVYQAVEFDLTMTADVSREGVLFETSRTSYQRGQEVAIVFPYSPMRPGEPVKEQRGQVVRVVRASENRFGVAVAFLEGTPEYELVDSTGNPLGKSLTGTPARPTAHGKPLVIHVDADQRIRALVRAELELHGYNVESLEDPNSAITVLRHRMPAVVISEAEAFPGTMPGGGEMSGYDLCVIVRRNAKYARVPVILTTRTGAPTDFSTAHALGASVCVSKPYDLSRIVNLLRMLSPVEA